MTAKDETEAEGQEITLSVHTEDTGCGEKVLHACCALAQGVHLPPWRTVDPSRLLISHGWTTSSADEHTGRANLTHGAPPLSVCRRTTHPSV